MCELTLTEYAIVEFGVMTDVLSPSQRSYCMSRIQGKDTKPEHIIRSGLFALGFRYRLHQRSLAGCPDLVLAQHKAVIFVHGCFWHGHGCHLFKWPTTDAVFWRKKIEKNKRNDEVCQETLRKAGWRVLTIWECALRGRNKADPNLLLRKVSLWLRSNRASAQF